MDRYIWSEDGMIVDTTKPWHDPDQDPDTATDEPLYEEIDDTVDLLNDQDFEIIALRAELEQVRGERDEALTKLDEATGFDGIMRQIDEHYPLDIPYFHDSSDPGCVAMRAQRQCLLETQRADAAEARVAKLEKVAEAARDYRDVQTALVNASFAAELTRKGLIERSAEELDAALAALDGAE